MKVFHSPFLYKRMRLAAAVAGTLVAGGENGVGGGPGHGAIAHGVEQRGPHRGRHGGGRLGDARPVGLRLC